MNTLNISKFNALNNTKNIAEIVEQKFNIVVKDLLLSNYEFATEDGFTLIKTNTGYAIVKDCLTALGIHHIEQFETLEKALVEFVQAVEWEIQYSEDVEEYHEDIEEIKELI